MPYCSSWEEFAKASERLYISDPMKVCWDISNSCCFKIAENENRNDQKICIL